MELSKRTDLAFRTLIYLATMETALCTIAEIAKTYDVPKSHLMKVVNTLVHEGFVHSTRGKLGGISLARPASDIFLNTVIEAVEQTLIPIDCIKQKCLIDGHCVLPKILGNAQKAYLDTLSKHSLADILVPSTSQVLHLNG